MVTLAHHANVAQGTIWHVAIIIIVGGCLGSGGLGVTLLAGSGKKRGRKEKCLLDRIKGVPPRRKAHFDATHNFVMKGPNR